MIGATSGVGLAVAGLLARRGDRLVVTSRDLARAEATAATLDGSVSGIAVDLSDPRGLAEQLAGVRDVQRLVIAAIERDVNSVREYDIDRALQLVTLKLVGYTETIHCLLPALRAEASIVLLGGLAKDRAYPGGTTVGTVNGGIEALVRTLAVELAPIRVNALHPGIVGDSPAWSSRSDALDAIRARTPTGRTIELADTADAVLFLLENRAVNGVNLTLDGGWLLT